MIIADDEPYNVDVVLGLIKILGMKDIDSLVHTSNDGNETVALVK